MKKLTTAIFIIVSTAFIVSMNSCIIKNPQPQECTIIDTKIIKITGGSSYDIVFHDNQGDFYYINRGLEQGLNLDSLNAKVLNKTVTLHLPKLPLGTSEHIAQLTVEDLVIFTEFD